MKPARSARSIACRSCRATRIRQRFEERFTARRMAHDYLAVYRSLMDGEAPRLRLVADEDAPVAAVARPPERRRRDCVVLADREGHSASCGRRVSGISAQTAANADGRDRGKPEERDRAAEVVGEVAGQASG